MKKLSLVLFTAALYTASLAAPLFAQAPPSFPPQQLDQLVARIALYPDSLLAQILAGATYSDQIPDAARWADQHHYLTGQALADAIQADQLPWDPSVQALLPFPSVLDTMASDLNWTRQLGDAFLAQQQDVMDAVQRERRKARDFGYLRSNGQIVVSGGPYIHDRAGQSGLYSGAVLRSGDCLYCAAAWIRGGRGDQFRLRHHAGHCVPAVGMGLLALRLGRTRGVCEQRSVAPHLGESCDVRSSLCDPAGSGGGTAAGRAARTA